MIRRPMKGVSIEDLSQASYPKWGSPKIDGFRCILGQHPLTSRMSRFPNYHFHNELEHLLPSGCILDAEVVVGKKRGSGVLQRTSSGLTSREGYPDFHLHVFDRPGIEDGWYNRYLAAHDLVGSLNHPRIHLLKHRLLRDKEEAQDFLEWQLELGYEGIILRGEEGPYKEGKATLNQQFMLKVKPFEDAEGKVIGYYEEQENTNEAKRENTGKLKRSSAKGGKVAKGRLGGLILLDCTTGVEVRVGGGFTQHQRIELWPIRETLLGELVKYKKQKMGELNKPRHPGFLSFRPLWDMSDEGS